MSSSKPTRLTPLGSALAGALGACFSTAVVYPLDVVKTRLQAAHGVRRASIISVLLEIIKKEGFGGYYRGFGATMLNTFSMQYAYFFFYSFVRTSYIKRIIARLPKGSKIPPLSTAAELALGAIAGALAQIFTIPVAVIATRQQIGRSLDKPRRRKEKNARKAPNGDLEKGTNGVPPSGSDSESAGSDSSAEDERYDDSFLGIAKEIVEEEGVTGLWLGLQPGLVLTVNPAITYGVYERVKNVMLLAAQKAGDNSGKLSPWATFSLGALSKTLATVVTYPYIMAKVRIQARSADVEDAIEHKTPKPHPHQFHHEKTHHVGALDILARVMRKEGIVGWYQGMGAQITKAVISQVLLFLSKEQFERWALAIIVLIWRIRHKAK
ncbi:hypothetical protein NM688_g2959 [Phlebia brevispora]|uniref:Uncharacterized protein n=1 Tax=Phlebia brevispora TaxID=194682 RepID=A0ACC1T7A4_9APHY|nr:hypothetical protein NM688_g2959 [Phlebia brevispora]